MTPAELREYRAKRDFDATPEPAPGAAGVAGDAPRFVVQRHDARRLHYDLRLEVDGALASWAVPKGLPLREGARRLAVRTEDHPLEYLDFAAVIPAGQYGAGRMTIWDRGTWREELRTDDEWKVVLEGDVVRGHYHLVRTGARGGRDEWLVFRSAKGPPGPPDPTRRFRDTRPMLAGASTGPFDDPAWAFELKWDGYRALALVTSDATELRSRSGRDISSSYPDLADLRGALLCQECVLDGEVVVLDARGKPDFNALQNGRGPFTYMVFDVLHVDGRWVEDLPWTERRALLARVVAPEAPPAVRLSDHVEATGTALFRAAAEQGLEGVIAKRMDAPYRPGRRVAEWRKIKARQEMTAVIGGFTEGAGSRRGTLGALIVGERDADGALVYRAHVGSGFSDLRARALWDRLRADEVGESPFAGPVPPAPQRPRWVRPVLECEVRFAERTPDGRLRAPVFHGLVEPEPSDAGPDVPSGPFGSAAGDREVREGERSVTLTNLDKPYWPREGITKGNLLDHYLRMAPVLVPHLAGRPMILKRYPNGVEEDFFFQHTVNEGPAWLRRADLSRGGKPGERTSRYVIVDDPMALLWLVNLGCIDLNPWQSLAATPDEPLHVLFDLDPADGLPFARVVEAALLVREALDGLGLRGYPRTSGASGMHILVPVVPGLTFEAVRSFARVVSEALVRARPDLMTTVTRVADRGPRVYMDHNQNGRGRSIASVYSVRPRPGAPVATPLRWEEVTPDLDPRAFTMGVVARRVERHGDLAAGLVEDRQALEHAVARLDGAAG
ncbi:DNA ligase D [Miltoncostaea marina]|uniref:DNA ligase D n=1 Tax=Miltoncostaea marina TaxID=2843215 RepID=UPI001C3C50E9|nr:DNA ligase D [Miltoncostaea marina]